VTGADGAVLARLREPLDGGTQTFDPQR
jgi:hypothetical protein